MARITFSDINVKIVKLTFNFRFFMARACRKMPPLAWVVDKLFFEGDNLLVIPRDSTISGKMIEDDTIFQSNFPINSSKEISINTNIPVPDNVVLPSQVIKEIINKSSDLVIMDSCLCRVSNDCKEYPHELGCLFIGPGAKNISKKLGKSVSPQEALHHITRCQDEGLLHIIGRNKLDSVWLNTGPKEELLTICNCCPCCCLWKMAPDLPENIGRSIGPMIGVDLIFDGEKCTGCNKCTADICFVNAIHLENGKSKIDYGKCRICGRCAEICPQNALKVVMAPDAVEKSVNLVEELVDL